jgi:NADH:ubiquinone oxidoreductase subunit E
MWSESMDVVNPTDETDKALIEQDHNVIKVMRKTQRLNGWSNRKTNRMIHKVLGY